VPPHKSVIEQLVRAAVSQIDILLRPLCMGGVGGGGAALNEQQPGGNQESRAPLPLQEGLRPRGIPVPQGPGPGPGQVRPAPLSVIHISCFGAPAILTATIDFARAAAERPCAPSEAFPSAWAASIRVLLPPFEDRA
jgi:hypothetical protein